MPVEFKPQPGPQTHFLSTPADLAIFGGARGGGKSYGLLLDAMRNVRRRNYSAVLFRRTYPQIFQDGGLWDTSELIYPYAGAQGSSGNVGWVFPSGAMVSFRHMENEKDRYAWLGAQIPMIGFDELATFTEKQLFFMLGSNRDPHGNVKPYIRATTNPEPGWLAKFIQWWWDPETGYAIPERSGKLRWFVRVKDSIVWADTAEELKHAYPGQVPKSVTFIPSRVQDNKILLHKDPGYLANLMAQSLVDQERYLRGNWKIRATAGMLFNRSHFRIAPSANLHSFRQFCRFWDIAATEETDENTDPDWTCGVLLGLLEGQWWILDVRRFRLSPKEVEDEIRRVAKHDPPGTLQRMEMEPGASGKTVIDYYARTVFPGLDFVGTIPIRRRVQGDYQYANPFSSAVANGNVFILDRPWTSDFLDECEALPDGAHDDQVIATASGMAVLSGAAGAGVVSMVQSARTQYTLVGRQSSFGV